MRSTTRRTILSVLAGVLTAILALPASAGQIIEYAGETSQADPVDLEVLKRESGRRFLREIVIFFTVTCEDGSTGSLAGIGFNRYRRGLRLSESGEFKIDKTHEPLNDFVVVYHLMGTVGFGSADGTFELRYATLTEDEQPQLCTTGVVDWSADRRGSRPARISSTSLPAGVTFLRDRSAP